MPPLRKLMILMTILPILCSIVIISVKPPSLGASPTPPVGISLYPAGFWPDYRELYYPLLCGSKGTLLFTINPPPATIWYGIAIELPREFGGLADGLTVNVKSTITNNYSYIKVLDEARYYSYNMSAPFWVEVANPSGFSDLRYIFIEGLIAPSIASRYVLKCYYSFTQPTPAHPTAFDYSSLLPTKDTNKPPVYYTLVVPVSMSIDPATVNGRVLDDVTGLPITTKGIVTASRDGVVWAKAFVNPEKGRFSLTGLAPGTYTLNASAGYCTAINWTTVGYSYPAREPYTITVGRRETISNLDLILFRGGAINGSINWETAPPVGRPFRVEVHDSTGMLRGMYSGVSAGSTIDYWEIRESPDQLSGFLDGNYTVKVWAYGCIQQTSPTIFIVGGRATASVSISMERGGLITGSVTYSQAPPPGESVLVEAYDEREVLRGVFIGTTSGSASDAFRIRGLSETEGETDISGGQVLASHSGRGCKDCGLLDGGYKLKAWVVGYLNHPTASMVTISNRSTVTTIVPLIKGGEISGKVLSKTPDGADNPFAYPGAPIRIYFYDSTGRSIGYISLTQLALATNVTYSAFKGFAWKSLDLGYVKMGFHDTGFANETYTIKVYTKGYIQPVYPTIAVTGSGVHYANFAVFQSGRVHGTLTFKAGTYLASVRGLVSLEVYSSTGSLQGTSLYEMTMLSSGISYDIFGFYQYTHPNGTSIKDYGLPDGNYTMRATLNSIEVSGAPTDIPRGFIGFVTTTTLAFSITKGSAATLNFDLYQIGLVYGIIRGYTVYYAAAPIPLSWASVGSSTKPISTSTLDGIYYLGLPEGSHDLTISCRGYQNSTTSMTIGSGTFYPFNPIISPFKPYLIVSLIVTPNPLDEAAGQLSTICRALIATNDGSIPNPVQYSWKCSGGTLNSTTGRVVQWVAPKTWETVTHRITCLASAPGYESGSAIETIIVYPIPEFPLGATLTLVAVFGLTVYLLRWGKQQSRALKVGR